MVGGKGPDAFWTPVRNNGVLRHEGKTPGRPFALINLVSPRIGRQNEVDVAFDAEGAQNPSTSLSKVNDTQDAAMGSLLPARFSHAENSIVPPSIPFTERNRGSYTDGIRASGTQSSALFLLRRLYRLKQKCLLNDCHQCRCPLNAQDNTRLSRLENIMRREPMTG